jgi:multidrug efflux pump subunit AcrA (membrane-fusion protein)
MLVRAGLPVLAVVALGFAVFSTQRLSKTANAEAPVQSPPRSQYRSQVGAVGLVEASSENVAISVPVPGLVTRVAVAAGGRVRKGDILFQLDDRDLRAELALRHSNADVARARLAKLEAGTRPEEIPPARARVAAAEAQLADAQTQLRLIEAVQDKRAVREEDRERRRRAADAAQARLEEARSTLALLEAGTWKPEIDVARADLHQTEKQMERVQADIARLIVTAPMSGTILQCKVRAGEFAPAGVLTQPLILMGATDQLHVRADIDEKDAWRFSPGRAAIGAVRGNAELRYPLRFVRLEPYVVPKRSLTGDATERVDTRVLQVIYSLPKDAKLYLGQQMDISIAGN